MSLLQLHYTIADFKSRIYIQAYNIHWPTTRFYNLHNTEYYDKKHHILHTIEIIKTTIFSHLHFLHIFRSIYITTEHGDHASLCIALAKLKQTNLKENPYQTNIFQILTTRKINCLKCSKSCNKNCATRIQVFQNTVLTRIECRKPKNLPVHIDTSKSRKSHCTHFYTYNLKKPNQKVSSKRLKTLYLGTCIS